MTKSSVPRNEDANQYALPLNLTLSKYHEFVNDFDVDPDAFIVPNEIPLFEIIPTSAL